MTRSLLLLVCLLPIVAGLGCGRDQASDMFASVNSSNIQRVANLYCVYQAQHNFKGPANEQELKDFIANLDPSRHKYFGIDVNKLDQLFISERDKQPFKIRWGLEAKPRQGPIPIAFEQGGVKGRYMVAFSSFQVDEYDQFEYDELWAGRRDEQIPDSNRGAPPPGGR